MDAATLRSEAMELDLIAFRDNDGYLTKAVDLLREAADEIERLTEGSKQK